MINLNYIMFQNNHIDVMKFIVVKSKEIKIPTFEKNTNIHIPHRNLFLSISDNDKDQILADNENTNHC